MLQQINPRKHITNASRTQLKLGHEAILPQRNSPTTGVMIVRSSIQA